MRDDMAMPALEDRLTGFEALSPTTVAPPGHAPSRRLARSRSARAAPFATAVAARPARSTLSVRLMPVVPASVAKPTPPVDIAAATVEAARVNWPVAECRDIALVCCTHETTAIADSPAHVRAGIAALIAAVLNVTPAGATVTCVARTTDDQPMVSVTTTRSHATWIEVSRTLRQVQQNDLPSPERHGLALDLWRAARLAGLAQAHLAFVPKSNGNLAFELHFHRAAATG